MKETHDINMHMLDIQVDLFADDNFIKLFEKCLIFYSQKSCVKPVENNGSTY